MGLKDRKNNRILKYILGYVILSDVGCVLVYLGGLELFIRHPAFYYLQFKIR